MILVLLNLAGTPIERVWWVMGRREVRVGLAGLPERVAGGTLDNAGGARLCRHTCWGVFDKLNPYKPKAGV